MYRYSYHTINHPDLAPERREWMLKQAALAKIDLNFFKSITPADVSAVPHQYDESWTRLRHGRAMKPTELACTLSHMQLWRNLLDSEDDYYVIMEDDMELPPNLDEIIQECLRQNKGQFIKLSALGNQPYKTLSTLSTGHQFVRYRLAPFSAGAYIISRSGAETLASYSYRVRTVVDEMTRRTWEHGVTNYGVLPLPVIHAPNFESVIGDRRDRYDHNNPWMKGFSRLCRFADHVRKRLVIPRE